MAWADRFLGLERRLEKFGKDCVIWAMSKDQYVTSIGERSSRSAARFAAELVALNADVIVAGGSLAVRAAQQVTEHSNRDDRTSDQLVRFVASLARPGGTSPGLACCLRN